LAFPLVVAVSTALSAKNGLLIRNRTAFESARKISTVVFDKTGTLTTGEFGVSSMHILDEQYEEQDVLQLAASVEQHSEHPIASGIVSKAKEQDIDILNVEDFKAFKGEGVQATVQGKNVKVVSPNYLPEHDIAVDDGTVPDKPGTRVFLLIDNAPAAVFFLSDAIRDESENAIHRLKQDGIQCWMLTGDTEETAKRVSEQLKLDGYFAEVLPHEKQDKIKELQGRGEFVAMTGDGVNDAPALAQADVGIAIGSGTDVAAETADIVLVNSNPHDVTALILFGKATHRKMIQNFIWATGYNVFAIPLAAGVLAPIGIMISPAVGAVLMSLSTVIVAINAKLLRVNKEG
jgi:Cu2+-exporting ATPase